MEVNKAQKSSDQLDAEPQRMKMLVKIVKIYDRVCLTMPDNLVWYPYCGEFWYPDMGLVAGGIPARNHHDLHLPAAAHNMRLRLRKVLLAGRENDPSGIWLFVAFVGMALETYLTGVQ
jgi:hypothetical protein